MRLASGVAAALALAALGWGCTQDSASPSPTGLEASSVAGEDFDYIARPPNVQVTSGTVVPSGLPFCRSGLVCYTPNFVRSAYNFPSTLNGAGQTILIVDAFGSPTVAQDLATFDARFGIPAPPSFTILCPQDGCPAFDPSDTHHDEAGWSIETSLDVQYAHAMAPGANIVLVVASTSSGNAINLAEAAAIARYPGSIMSQSFGIPEIFVHANNAQIQQAHKNYLAAQAAGITVLASAGDFGATNGFGTANAGFPASDPLVTGVGGTQGNPYLPPRSASSCTPALSPCNAGLAQITGTCGTLLGGSLSGPACAPAGYGGEQVWNESVFGVATGGAPSKLFGVPSYQSGLGLTTRTIPDVAYNAAINGGVLVVWTAIPAQAGIYIVGGTSAGSPQWASIVALANQLKGGPVGFINPTLYQIGCSARYGSDFHDVTVGNNQLTGTPVGFPAAAGWDDATGLGTPNVANLVQDLVTPPSCS
jgi:subtilase family serine protease